MNMLSLDTRIDLLAKLGTYMASDDISWKETMDKAVLANAWFTPEHISLAVHNIATQFLKKDKLQEWVSNYHLPEKTKVVGIVMAGNIPLVGFHDFLCGYITGHTLVLKLSSKDEVLLKHLIQKLVEWEPAVAEQVKIADVLKGCNAYIATGSNNSARYFEQYFGKYPSIIRKNRTSVAILDGDETDEELSKLADDVFNYYGLGCRNVTQLCVPVGYDFSHLLEIFSKYDHLMLHHKYKNNYDYHLALYLLNKINYQTNGSVLVTENFLPFSAVSVLHYRFYENKSSLIESLKNSNEIQSIVNRKLIPFGTSQQPALNDYADGIDTMAFLCE